MPAYSGEGIDGDRRVEVVDGGIPVLGRGGDPGEAPVSERRGRVVARAPPRMTRVRPARSPVADQRVTELVAIPGQFGPLELFVDRSRHGRSRCRRRPPAGSPSTKARWLRRTRAAAESATCDELLVRTAGRVHVAERERGVAERGERRRVVRARRPGSARAVARASANWWSATRTDAAVARGPGGSRGWLRARRRAPSSAAT